MKLVNIFLLLSLLSSAVSAKTDLTNNSELGGVLEALADENFPASSYATNPVCVTSDDWPQCLNRFTTQSAKSRAIFQKHTPRLEAEFKKKGLEWGAPIYIRVFKHPTVQPDPEDGYTTTFRMAQEWSEGRVEVWVGKPDNTYALFKTYPVCALPGKPGPKWMEGDYMTPEGFYDLDPGKLNPNSKYHLSFDIGYPNAYDVACHADGKKSIGNEIFVHGKCVSAGCMAMTDPVMEEIYTIADTSITANEIESEDGSRKKYRIPFHAFPFPMTDENLSKLNQTQAESMDLVKLGKSIAAPLNDQLDVNKFWSNLKEGYDYFEQRKTVPEVTVEGKNATSRYIFSEKKGKIVKRRCI